MFNDLPAFPILCFMFNAEYGNGFISVNFEQYIQKKLFGLKRKCSHLMEACNIMIIDIVDETH